MKLKTFSLVLLLMLSYTLVAQEKQELKRSIGFTFSAIGSNDVTNSERASLLGGESYSGKRFFTLGVSYVHPILSWIAIESGIEYSKHTITVEPMKMPNFPYTAPYDKSVSLINIPITARVSFLKYFFINGGLILDLEAANSSPIESQTGVGTLLGIGAKYSLSNGFGAFVNGYYKAHTLVPFSANNDDYRWRLIEGGLRIGVTYSF